MTYRAGPLAHQKPRYLACFRIVLHHQYDPPEYNAVATLWNAGKPAFVQALDFQGHFGVANKVNDFRIVVGGYWSDSCAQGCAVAIQIR